jgi:hypothetical protein
MLHLGIHSPNTHPFLNIRRSNPIPKTGHKLRNPPDVNNVPVSFASASPAPHRTQRVDGTCSFSGFGVDFYDLRASGNL